MFGRQKGTNKERENKQIEDRGCIKTEILPYWNNCFDFHYRMLPKHFGPT